MTAPPYPELEPLGDSALLLRFGHGVDAALNGRVHRFAAALEAAGLPGLRGLVPAFDTLAVHYDPAAFAAPDASPFDLLTARLRALAWDAPGDRDERAILAIPVCYGGAAGPDLEAVAAAHGLSPEEVIRRHTAPVYRVFMLGFLPGFPYLGGLDPALATPRRASPRTAVPAGSVAIGGAQTGIYPVASPGGWHLLGRTPRSLFDPARETPCLLRPGDRLRFMPVDADAGGEAHS